MRPMAPLLADGDSSIGAVIFAVVGILVWIFRTIASSTANVKAQQQLRNRLGQMPPDVANRGRIVRPPAQGARRLTPIAQPMSRMVQGQTPPRYVQPPPLPRKAPQAVPQAAAAAGAAAPVAVERSRAAATVPVSVVKATPMTLAAILRPENLRTQFILTELLQQPLTLRPERQV